MVAGQVHDLSRCQDTVGAEVGHIHRELRAMRAEVAATTANYLDLAGSLDELRAGLAKEAS